MLTPELAQSIVRKTISILGKNINLMNSQGVIMASGDDARLNKFHEGALLAINSGETLEVHSCDVDSLKGVRPGVNLPINFGGKVVGAVGITGNPEDVRNYGQLVKHTVELMIESAALREQVQLELQAVDSLVHDIIYGTETHQELLFMRGKALGVDLSLPRVALTVGIEGFGETARDMLFRDDSLDSEIFLQQLKSRLALVLRSFFLNQKEELVGFMGKDKFVVLKTISSKEAAASINSSLSQICEEIRGKVFKEIGLKVNFGIGTHHSGVQGMADSFRESLEALTMGRKFAPEKYIYLADDLRFESAVSLIPPYKRQEFFRRVLGQLIHLDKKDYYLLLHQTVQALFEHNLNLSEAAKALFIHRNTMLFRVRRIKNITGYDPTSFTDAVYLKMALACWGLDEKPVSNARQSALPAAVPKQV